ncbi:MAG: hypothetical protein JWM21_62 [Acidobacteria bacterium]|nr:hypothetical protein [Acidobacteriota bacterium]
MTRCEDYGPWTIEPLPHNSVRILIEIETAIAPVLSFDLRMSFSISGMTIAKS